MDELDEEDEIEDENLLAAIEKELESGDYITLSRVTKGYWIQETIVTFSNTEITWDYCACDATPEWESEKNSESSA